eukprot:gene11830-15831_t
MGEINKNGITKIEFEENSKVFSPLLENQVLSCAAIPLCIVDSDNRIKFKNEQFDSILLNNITNQISEIVDSIEPQKKQYFMGHFLNVSSTNYHEGTKHGISLEDCKINGKFMIYIALFEVHYLSSALIIKGLSWNIYFSKLPSERILLQFVSSAPPAKNTVTSSISRFGNAFLDDHEAVVDFLENAPRAFHVVDQDFKIIWGNHYELKLLGYARDEFIGHNLRDFFNGDVEINKTLATFNCGINDIDRSFQYQTKDSSVHVMRVVANRRLLGDNKWTSRSVLSDDTEAFAAAEAKEEQRKTTEKMLELKRTIVRYISHEIRSPLNVLYGGLQLLTDDPMTKLNPDLSESVNDLFTCATHAVEILDDMLNYERFEAGKFEVNKVMTPLHNWDIVSKCRPLMKLAHIGKVLCYLNWPPHDNCHYKSQLLMKIDSIRINQVIRKLVTNAINSCQIGDSVTVSFEINNHNVGEIGSVASLDCNITDTGAGMSLDKQQLFAQFSSFNRNILEGGGGVGLGLWISKTIINLHGGNLKCFSEGEGKGSTFYFSIPLYSLDNEMTVNDVKNQSLFITQSNDNMDEKVDDQFKISVEKENEFYFAGSNKNYNYLLVDDLQLNRKILGRLLSSIDPNCSIYEADDGSTAINLVKTSSLKFDVIFLDFVMTSVHGPEIAHSIRNEYGYAGPIIGVTGNALKSDIIAFESAGVNTVLTKPVRKDSLIKTLQHAKSLLRLL